MNTRIFYFTAAGNSLYIARRLSEKLGGCAVASMASRVPQEAVGGPGNAVGFVFPVFFVGLPRLVAGYIKNLVLLPGTYCFSLISHGGSPMDTLGMLEDLLAGKGLRLSYGRGVKMPNTYLFKNQAAVGGAADRLFNSAERTIEAAAADITARTVKRIGRFGRSLTRKYNALLYEDMEEWDEHFRAEDACSGCGLCSEICPADNIRMIDGRPAWQHRCERCLACIHWCPLSAIEYGRYTVNRRRYHHPEVSAADMKKGAPRTA